MGRGVGRVMGWGEVEGGGGGCRREGKGDGRACRERRACPQEADGAPNRADFLRPAQTEKARGRTRATSYPENGPKRGRAEGPAPF